jgi:hypothetical protein
MSSAVNGIWSLPWLHFLLPIKAHYTAFVHSYLERQLLATFRIAVLTAAANVKEPVMLRSIFAALRSGLRGLFGFAFTFITWPFRLFGGGGGRSAAGPNMATLKTAEQSLTAAHGKDSKVAQSTPRDADLKRDAQIAWSTITAALLARQQLLFPSALSKKMQSWLQGLDHGQLEALQNARVVGICAHVAGTKAIAGVPSVKPLAPLKLKFPPIAKPDAEISGFGFSLSR